MSMTTSDLKVGIVRFPGSNCEQDAYEAIEQLAGATPVYLWHNEPDLQGVDMVFLPGGFSYGDYLRSGAIARFAPIMKEVSSFAQKGGLVLGVCNGFQVLTEAGLLPGTLIQNAGMRFVCERDVPLTVENNTSRFTHQYQIGETLYLPVAHGDGNYQCDPSILERMEGEGQVAFRYGRDINGSVNRIAGVLSPKGNVLGMMPHPERNLSRIETTATAAPVWTGDGQRLFTSLVQQLASSAVA